jgi:hypothetical protein
MVLNRSILLFLFLTSFSFESFALDNGFLESIQFKKGTKISYQQERFIKSTNFKLISSGELTILDDEIRWNQLKPFTQPISRKNGVMAAGNIGESKEVKNHIAKKMERIMFDLFQGNLKALKAVFELKRIKPDINLSLTPKDEDFARFVKTIHLSGREEVQRFFLEEKSGNSLTIRFSKQKLEKSN